MEIVFATNNENKIIEVKSLFPKSIKILSLSEIGCYEEIHESGKTLKENAQIKVDYIRNKYSIDCFADDSGLEVKSLNGSPGVLSARFAGIPKNDNNNIKKLLNLLKDKKNTEAQFRTLIAIRINSLNQSFEGTLEGSISLKIKGTNGFGYDPIFIPKGYNKTLGELSSSIKNTISHRAIATLKLLYFLKNMK